MRSLLTSLAVLFVAAAASAQTAAPHLSGGVDPRYFGSVPETTVSSTAIPLTILDVINRALTHNLGLLTASTSVSRAQAARWDALAELLPNVSGRVSEARQVVNLAVFGFPLPAGVPSIVGPFNLFDARLSVSQSVFDLSAIKSARAETHRVSAAQFEVRGARDLVVLVSANAYLQTLAASARAESARAQAASADAIFKQASDMKASGMVAGIDVLRAEVEFSTERQRATAAVNEFEKSKLQLARIIGLPIGQTFTLSDSLPYVPAPELTLDQALAQAYATRPDYQAALARVRAAEADRGAVVSEHLPSIGIDADYGTLGTSPGDAERTYRVMGTVNIPIFNGGRTKGRLIEADADLRNRRAEADDLKAAIYYDVKTAFLDLQATGEQLQVATRARELSAQQLTQARDRFAAGVANNVEVVQAQQAVAESSEQYISALYGFNVAKALLARGLGVAEQATRDYLGGVR